MKRTITAILCALTIQMGFASDTNTVQKSDEKVTCIEVIFVLAVVGVGGWIVITLYSKCPKATDRVMVYIDESTDGRATWHCIATNGPVVLNGTDPLEVYRSQTVNDSSFYRARIHKMANLTQ